MGKTVVFLGAGATKSLPGGLLTDEILPTLVKSNASQQDPSGKVNTLFEFLTQEFHVDPNNPDKRHYPSLPLLMSLVDTALDRREPLYGRWDLNTLATLRQAIEFGIFDALEDKLDKTPTTNHYTMFRALFPGPEEPCVISTNYDLIADSAMMFLGQSTRPLAGLPNYYCGISIPLSTGAVQRFGTLLKLHGSLNWMLCKNCLHMELGRSDYRLYLKIIAELAGPDLKTALLADGAPCPVCQTLLRPLLVAPSHLKDYRNPHLAQVWYEAQRVLRQADRVIFVGYSLPDDDVEVVYLVKRSLGHIVNSKQITVVEFCEDNRVIRAADHPVGRRYQALFGDIDWWAGGLDSWVTMLSTKP
jgi:hypothetical protein